MRHQKLFGQNFLKDIRVIARIIDEAKLANSNTLMEIGPGKGAITEPLSKIGGKKLIAIEKDYVLVDFLKEKFAKNPNFEVISSDFLEFDFDNFISTQNLNTGKIAVISNLPYSVGSRIFVDLCKQARHLEFCVLMFQKEVADRIAASPNSKTYGILSVIAQCVFEVKKVILVPPSAFKPAPNVDSLVIKVTPIEPKIKPEEMNAFIDFVKKAFSQRRKTLKNSLGCEIAIFEKAQIDSQRRPENLSIDEFVRLFYAYL